MCSNQALIKPFNIVASLGDAVKWGINVLIWENLLLSNMTMRKHESPLFAYEI